MGQERGFFGTAELIFETFVCNEKASGKILTGEYSCNSNLHELCLFSLLGVKPAFEK